MSKVVLAESRDRVLMVGHRDDRDDLIFRAKRRSTDPGASQFYPSLKDDRGVDE